MTSMKRTRKSRSQKVGVDPNTVLARRIHRAGSQRRLAEELGVSESYLSDVKNGARPFSVEFLAKLGLTVAIVESVADK